MSNVRHLLILIFVVCLKFSQGSDDCGVSDIDPERLATNGKRPMEQDWPWMAILYFDDGYATGGSISKKFFFLFFVHKALISIFCFIQFLQMQ